MSDIIYVLKIYERGSDEPRQTFESSQPFMAIHVGDLVHAPWSNTRNVRVINVRHSIQSIVTPRPELEAKLRHQIEVFTERSPIEDVRELSNEMAPVLELRPRQ